jgi:DNA mismatch repair protein MutL
MAAMFVNLPSDQLDVNVHPTKHEVRFSKQKLVHDLVQSAVIETLDREDRPQWGGKDFSTGSSNSDNYQVSEKQDRVYHTPPVNSKADRSTSTVQRHHDGQTKSKSDRFDDGISHLSRKPSQPSAKSPDNDHEQWRYVPGKRREQGRFWQPQRFGDLRIIGQLRNSYIACESTEGLLLLDQHAAHERVLYEMLKKRSESLIKEAQRLLVPETIELGFREAGIMEELLNEFKGLGLEIEPFGTNTFLVRSVPAMLTGHEIEPLIREILEELAAEGFNSGLEQPLDVCLKLMACHGSIRARQALDDRQMRRLLQQLDDCDNPSHCPHGRPTWLQWTSRELEKAFNRIV